MNPAVWKYRLDADYSIQLPVTLNIPNGSSHILLRDASGVVRASLASDGTLRVLAGYAWDGCSPKWRIGDILIGTPDAAPDEKTGLPKTYYASLIHDVLCQFEIQLKGILTRLEIDRIFLWKLIADGFAQARIYYIAVRSWAWVRVLHPVFITWWQRKKR
ncbi:hypothetical protein [Thiothrix sp.]|jgi:hypothetical protein|uniref:hypothetical protein n=1 Tax=Thiothrix sp. TaxID=1032 RepID=UPI002579C588|nr:hypothetical protein [Thiothrix sp.]